MENFATTKLFTMIRLEKLGKLHRDNVEFV